MPAKSSVGFFPWVQVNDCHYINMNNVRRVLAEEDHLIVSFVGGLDRLSFTLASREARAIMAWVKSNSEVY